MSDAVVGPEGALTAWETPMRLIFALVTALGSAVPGPLAKVEAQTPSPDLFVAVGCVARATHNGSIAGSPGVPPASPNTAPTLANSSEPTQAFMLNEAVVKPSAPSDQKENGDVEKPRTFVLDGPQKLDAHVGHRMEVTGKIVRAYGGAKAGDKEPVDHIQVASLKMVGSDCATATK